jgi:Tol biopolymer transport system component
MSGDLRVSMALQEHGTNPPRDLTWLDFTYGPRISQDGSTILFTDESGQSGNPYDVYVRKADGSPAARIASNGFGTDISPDGKWALVVLPGDSAARIQIVPVGPGQPRSLHWDGFQPAWAHWSPDGQHIMMIATTAGHGTDTYVTDINGATPKLIGGAMFPGIGPDGDTYITSNGTPELHSMSRDFSKAIPIDPQVPRDEKPVGWSADVHHIFVARSTSSGLEIYKFDLDSGKQELWQTLKAPENVGLMPMNTIIGITPDGRWMAFTYSIQLAQIFRSDNLR